MLRTLERSRATFMDHISKKDSKTLAGYVQALNNFENYCLEKEAKADVTTDLKLLPVEDQLTFLQGWINWNGSLSPRSVKNYFSRVKIYIHYRGIKFYPLDLKELVFERASKEELHGLSVKEINTIFGVLRYKHLCSLCATCPA